MSEAVVTVTKKGQATIPKGMRDRHKIGRKALVIDTDKGVLVRSIPDPSMEKGSLKTLFKGRTSKEIMSEIRQAELRHEAKRSGQQSR
jgi:bifunctional DNA-binding transcriptional regulator/antitoxin component of YhaV-PrlF toxin-antitoxin module